MVDDRKKITTALVPRVIREVQFYEDVLMIAIVGEIPYVALRPIAEFLGLDWQKALLGNQSQHPEQDTLFQDEDKSL